MFNAEDKTPPTGAISELDQFFSTFQTYGQGDHDGVLLWWKVSTLNCDWYSLAS
jgi:hypothetical protein